MSRKRKVRTKDTSGEAILKAATALDDLQEDIEIRNVVVRQLADQDKPPRNRRAVRLVPDQKPISWSDYI